MVWNVDSVVLHEGFSAFTFLSSVIDFTFFLLSVLSYLFIYILPLGQLGQVICVIPRLCLAQLTFSSFSDNFVAVHFSDFLPPSFGNNCSLRL